jgi:4-amino-4-deoxy-L-arabinose transferase-like glycosyltransferase
MNLGMDSSAHVEYIDFIIQNRSLPQAYEGWEGHQAPLYYLLCAGLHVAWSLCGALASEHAYRVVSLFCLIAQVEVVYRVMRTLFPGEVHNQCVGLILGSTVPMSVLVCQYVGNEPLAGLLGSLVLLLCLRSVRADAKVPNWHRLVLIGIALGGACLAKVTGALLVPVVFASVLSASTGLKWSSRLVRAAVPLLTCACICGWWGARNLLAIGHLWADPWDFTSKHLVWWQEPGYRTIADIAHFGSSIDRPICAVTAGLWDGLYAGWCCDSGLSGSVVFPPWNYTLMLMLPILYLPIGLSCALGVVASVREEGVRVRACMLGASMLYAAAIMYSYASMPCYSSAKPTYALALTPIIAAFSVLGMRVLPRTSMRDTLACGWSTLTAAITIGAFWAQPM